MLSLCGLSSPIKMNHLSGFKSPVPIDQRYENFLFLISSFAVKICVYALAHMYEFDAYSWQSETVTESIITATVSRCGK